MIVPFALRRLMFRKDTDMATVRGPNWGFAGKDYGLFVIVPARTDHP